MSSHPKPGHAAYEKAVRESFGRQGLMGTIGAWLVEVAPGRVVIELPFSARVSQQQGLFHGAAIGALGDSAGGYAALTLMPAGSEVMTIEYKINFLLPAKGNLARAEAQVLRAGKTVTVTRVDISVLAGEKSALCAVLQATMMRVPKSSL